MRLLEKHLFSLKNDVISLVTTKLHLLNGWKGKKKLLCMNEFVEEKAERFYPINFIIFSIEP